ncbi:hypothetical protein D5S18_14870 [Nocardia panacis]|uniref:Uncharacterized protein n=1 Tax=Nocardia panacis TaxID=2340916 RepID=A0A3A4K884_9NOCA|nr:hypothetical protein [Nocardia panacis]RJO75274.1 hypothetical protein D5S18_14870 [Nocardia panacis]
MHTETAVVLFLAGVIFLVALLLGVWKWRAMSHAPGGLAHPYVDIAHRAALMYSFATVLIALFVELSGWSAAVNLGAGLAIIVLFMGTIANYIRLGLQRQTVNQMHNPPSWFGLALAVLILGEIGGFSVLLTGFAAGQI